MNPVALKTLVSKHGQFCKNVAEQTLAHYGTAEHKKKWVIQALSNWPPHTHWKLATCSESKRVLYCMEIPQMHIRVETVLTCNGLTKPQLQFAAALETENIAAEPIALHLQPEELVEIKYSMLIACSEDFAYMYSSSIAFTKQFKTNAFARSLFQRVVSETCLPAYVTDFLDRLHGEARTCIQMCFGHLQALCRGAREDIYAALLKGRSVIVNENSYFWSLWKRTSNELQAPWKSFECPTTSAAKVQRDFKRHKAKRIGRVAVQHPHKDFETYYFYDITDFHAILCLVTFNDHWKSVDMNALLYNDQPQMLLKNHLLMGLANSPPL